MKKKLIFGALALSAVAAMGLTGCDKEKKKDPTTPPPTQYTITFDHDNNPNTPNTEVKYDEGTTVLDANQIPTAPVDPITGYDAIGWDWNGLLTDQDMTVVAKYGNGTESSPYLISKPMQMIYLLREYSAVLKTEYLDANGAQTAQALSVKKVEYYKAIKKVYTRSTTESDWEYNSTILREGTDLNQHHYKLTQDIILTNTYFINGINLIDLNNVYFNGVLDGNGHTLVNFDGSLFTSSQGALFKTIVGATFKNLNVQLGSNMGSLAYIARGGANVFNNVTIKNNVSGLAYITADDNNESPFICHAIDNNEVIEHVGDVTLSFINCTNEANFVSSADYAGIFLGGYAKNIKGLEFVGCVNKGIIKSIGSVGMLVGNGAHKPGAITVMNCKNEGTISTQKASHILVSHKIGVLADKIAEYDTNNNGYDKFTLLESDYSATVSGKNVVVASKDAENVAAGQYQFILSGLASSTTDGSLLLNVIISEDLTEDAENKTFNNVYYGMMDLNTYNTTFTKDVQSGDTNYTWTTLKGYNIKYFKDVENGVYVFDMSVHEKDNGITSPMVINKTANQLSKVVVVHSTQNQNITDIKFIAEFN